MYNVNATRLPDWHGHSMATHPLDDGLIVNAVDKFVFTRYFSYTSAHRPSFHQALLKGPHRSSYVHLTKQGNASFFSL